MPRQYGYLESDDENLKLGQSQKKKGALSQNLYDPNGDGKIKGQARFIPVDNDDDSSEEDYLITNYVHEEKRQFSEADNAVITIASSLVAAGVCYGVVRATPHIKRLWKEKVKPFFRSKVKGLKDQQHSVHHDLEVIPVVEEEATDSKVSFESHSTDIAIAQKQPTMSSDEAKDRLILAAVGRVYSDEQLQMVINAHIIDADIDADELKAIFSYLRQLPHAKLFEMARNLQIPEADLATLLKQICQPETRVIDNRQLPRSRPENQLKRIDGDNS